MFHISVSLLKVIHPYVFHIIYITYVRSSVFLVAHCWRLGDEASFRRPVGTAQAEALKIRHTWAAATMENP